MTAAAVYDPAVDELDGAVFWSYAHEDDRSDSGHILTLAERLSDEYSLITGRQLNLFVDRDIAWGEEWRRRIDGALVETTFFVPILTPRYLSRPECRKEVTTFHTKVHGAGLGELLMPILYSHIPEFNDRNSDELIALLSRYQYEDWTALRLEDPGSAFYRKRVNHLARRLADAAQSVTEKQLDVEVTAVDTDEGDYSGLFDLAEEINTHMPDWLQAMETHWATIGQVEAVNKVYEPRFDKLTAQRAPAGSRFALMQRWANELLPLTERYKAEAMVYDKIRLELEPKVERAFALLENDPRDADVLEPFWSALEEANAGIEKNKTLSGGNWSDFWRSFEHLSQLARQVARNYGKAGAQINECNEAVERWIRKHDELEELRQASPV